LLGRLSLPQDPCVRSFPFCRCSLLSAARSSPFFFSLFLWFWKLVLEKRRSVGFLFHCPPLYVPFPCFAVLFLVSLVFFFFVPSLFSFVLSVYFFRVLPLSFFRSQSLSISPAGSPWLFRAPRFYSCFSFPRFCPFSLVFLPPVRGFFFSLLCFFEKKQRNASLLFFFLFPPSVLSLSLGVFLFSLF